MEQQRLFWEWIPLIIFALLGIAVGIRTFFKLKRQFGKKPFDWFLAVVGGLIAACGTFFILAAVFAAVHGRWCEGCQEYH